MESFSIQMAHQAQTWQNLLELVPAHTSDYSWGSALETIIKSLTNVDRGAWERLKQMQTTACSYCPENTCFL